MARRTVIEAEGVRRRICRTVALVPLLFSLAPVIPAIGSYSNLVPTGWMLRLPGSLKHAHRHWLTSRALIVRKPKLPVQSRSIIPYAKTVLDNRSFSASSSIMDEFPSNACQGAGTLDDVIKRSKNSSDVQKIVLELPKVASIPPRKRTFHINHEDLETLVRPLLSYHWHVGRVGNIANDSQAFTLNKLFNFKNFRSAVDFFDALADIQNEEDHHARVTVDYSNVYISTHTHVAYQRTSDSDVESKPIKVPGLTSRDIRFAVKVEMLHEQFLGDGRAVTKVPVDSASLRAWSMEQLRRQYPASHG